MKGIYYLCTNQSEINETNFSKIKEKFFDYSNAVTDNKLQTFVKTNIKKEIFGKSSEILTEDNQLILLEMLVLMVVGKGDKLPSTTKLVFDFVTQLEHKKQFLEECFKSDESAKDLINCILLQVKDLRLDDDDIKEVKCNCDDERHQLLVEWLSNLFEVKDEEKYKEAFNSLAIAFIKTHGYDEHVVADCVQRQTEFRKEGKRNKAPIMESLISLLPVTARFGTLGTWLSIAVVLTILSSLFYLSDFGSDVFLGYEYYPEYNMSDQHFNDTKRGSKDETSLIEHQKLLREDYLLYLERRCTTSFTSHVIGATSANVSTNDENEIWSEQPYFVNETLGTNVCLGFLREMNKYDAFFWSFVFISFTILYHYFLLWYYPKSYDPMVRFYLGWCCESNLEPWDNTRFYFAKMIMGILLPYLTLLYNNILMPATLNQIESNRNKIISIKEALGSNDALEDKSFYPNYPKKEANNHFCSYCKNCKSEACFCPFCGFLNHTRQKDPTSKEYQSKIQKITTNISTLGGLNRLGEMTLENTYLPFIQCIMGVLQMSQENNPTNWIFTILSVASSVFSMSSSMMFIHFSNESKLHLSKKQSAKLCFVTAMTCQILSRMLTISFIGIYAFPYSNTISWLILGCIVHITLICASKFIVYYCYTELPCFSKDAIVSITLSSFSSVYTNTRIGKVELVNGLDHEVIEEESNSTKAFIEIDDDQKDNTELDTINETVGKAELEESSMIIGIEKLNEERSLPKTKDTKLGDNQAKHYEAKKKANSVRKFDNTRALIRKEDDYKLVDRLVFTTIILSQQVAILLIIHFFPFTERVEDLHIKIFYLSTIPLFIIGLLLEAIYYTFLNPEAKYRQRKGYRKSILSLTLFLIFLGGLVGLLYGLHVLKQTGYFIIILTIVIVLTLSLIFYLISSFWCKRVRDQVKFK